jgi:hypothetical protein
VQHVKSPRAGKRSAIPESVFAQADAPHPDLGRVEQQVSDVDKVIAVTGFRPDVTSLSEVRLDLDPVLSSTRALAAEIDPSFHSCGDVLPARVQRAHPT